MFTHFAEECASYASTEYVSFTFAFLFLIHNDELLSTHRDSDKRIERDSELQRVQKQMKEEMQCETLVRDMQEWDEKKQRCILSDTIIDEQRRLRQKIGESAPVWSVEAAAYFVQETDKDLRVKIQEVEKLRENVEGQIVVEKSIALRLNQQREGINVESEKVALFEMVQLLENALLKNQQIVDQQQVILTKQRELRQFLNRWSRLTLSIREAQYLECNEASSREIIIGSHDQSQKALECDAILENQQIVRSQNVDLKQKESENVELKQKVQSLEREVSKMHRTFEDYRERSREDINWLVKRRDATRKEVREIAVQGIAKECSLFRYVIEQEMEMERALLKRDFSEFPVQDREKVALFEMVQSLKNARLQYQQIMDRQQLIIMEQEEFHKIQQERSQLTHAQVRRMCCLFEDYQEIKNKEVNHLAAERDAAREEIRKLTVQEILRDHRISRLATQQEMEKEQALLKTQFSEFPIHDFENGEWRLQSSNHDEISILMIGMVVFLVMMAWLVRRG